ncbi:MAG: response regulator, partial [Rhodospirillales bacterium]|nr:response regulator [Rhodospirillales bacterium]
MNTRTPPTATILVGDDDAAIRTVVRRALHRHGFAARDTGDMGELWSWISSGAGDLVITDVAMPSGNGLDLLPRVRNVRPDLPVIVISARSTMLTALRAGERGAFEYFPKPFDLDELVATVRRAIAETRVPAPSAADTSPDDLPMVGRSPAMQRVYRVVARVVNTNLTVLVLGESGTGKELVARALHDFSPRWERPFVALNMAAIPRDLIESER